ncbi:hypothetical protein [Candidatus Uabimicrobium sp. HlEnr_7]|uniref:hypothetical protein n=1 Tax=Candidatus Uabimicrobium helgolandensis TaxID=3095367 RepID=UPI00355806C2
MNKYIFFIGFIFCGCIQTVAPSKKLTQKPLLSDKELFAEEQGLASKLEEACANTGNAFQSAQKLALSTGKNICIIVDKNSVKIFELLERSSPPRRGTPYGEYELPANLQFAHKSARYFYCDYARRIDFDDPDVRLVTRTKNATADIIIEHSGRDGEKGLIDFTKNSPTIRYITTSFIKE